MLGTDVKLIFTSFCQTALAPREAVLSMAVKKVLLQQASQLQHPELRGCLGLSYSHCREAHAGEC